MKKINLPDTLVFIFFFVVIAALLTWILPGGSYERVLKAGRSLLLPE